MELDKKNETYEDESESNSLVKSMLKSTIGDDKKLKYNKVDFVDERELTSHDITGTKEMKIKVLEVSDEHPPTKWKLGNRVKVTKILVTIKHLNSQEVEEGEFDIEAIEKELIRTRHYSSTNRWVPTDDIKNGYVLNTRHTLLISSANALDYIIF